MIKFFKDKTSDIEKLRALEKRVTALNEKISDLDDELNSLVVLTKEAEWKKLRAEFEKQVNERKIENDEKYMQSIMKDTGWDHDHANEMYAAAHKAYGVALKTYCTNKLYNLPESEQPAEYKSILAKIKKKKQDRIAAKNEVYINEVIKATGWSRDKAVSQIEAAVKRNGVSYEHYVSYGFWNLSDKEQATYYTKRDADKIYRMYNPDKMLLKIFMDKDLFCKNFERYLGRAYLSTEGMTYSRFNAKFGSQEKIIYKPLSISGGKGIKVYELNDDNRKDVYSEIKKQPIGIVESYVIQHHEMKQFSINSVNTIRVVTIQTYDHVPGVERGKMHFLYAGIRMGCGKSYVDNLHSGGMIANIDINTGVVVTPAVDYNRNVYYEHPETGAQIVGFKIPYFDEIKQLISNACGVIPGYYGWDIAITEDGPIIIEANTHPAADTLQSSYLPEKKGMRYAIAKYLGEGTKEA